MIRHCKNRQLFRKLLLTNSSYKKTLGIFRMFMSRPTKMHEGVGEVKPKAKELGHFKAEAV